MDFLEIHELSVEELQIYSGIGREFLQLIETTDMQKVYKMPILCGFYNEGDVRLAVTDDEVVESWKKFFHRGTNWKDFPESNLIRRVSEDNRQTAFKQSQKYAD